MYLKTKTTTVFVKNQQNKNTEKQETLEAVV